MNDYKPAHLGVRSSDPIDRVDLIPWKGSPLSLTLSCKEFTSLCPVTGQPDFGEIIIEYVADAHLIETKSLKLYLLKYRNTGVFSEVLVDTIADDLWEQVQPKELIVRGTFASRGGIEITAEAYRPLEDTDGRG
jgi:7-cyano-7-deazaguanine reductase